MWTAKKMNANTVQVFLILLYGFVQYQKKEKKRKKNSTGIESLLWAPAKPTQQMVSALSSVSPESSPLHPTNGTLLRLQERPTLIKQC